MSLIQTFQSLIGQPPIKRQVDPLREVTERDDALKPLGEESIAAGSVGCLVVAGGQGTRLGWQGPKGTFPLGLRGESLFEILAKKIEARAPFAIMTSEENARATKEFFLAHHRFGIPLNNLFFFQQSSVPVLNQKGEPIDKDHPKCAPDGNGNSLKRFVESGLWQTWWERGIRFLTFSSIDNPLVNPIDPILLGTHIAQKNDVTMVAVKRKNAEEKVGVIGNEKGKIAVVEYHEMASLVEQAYANISFFCFSMEFVQRVAAIELPWHPIQKPLPDDPESKVWKFETYIFDVLSEAKRVGVLHYPREICFAPVKTPESVAEVKALLYHPSA